MLSSRSIQASCGTIRITAKNLLHPESSIVRSYSAIQPSSFSSPSSPSSLTSNNNNAQIIIRPKHSNTQVKKLFSKNPAKYRINTRNNTLPEQLLSPPEERLYPSFYEPSIVLPNGWSAPPEEGVTEDYGEIVRRREELPFEVVRTGNKPNGAVGFLPVYSNFKMGGMKKTTLIRRIKGDTAIFQRELKAALQISPDDTESIIWRGHGTSVEVKGNRTVEIKSWLAGLGF